MKTVNELKQERDTLLMRYMIAKQSCDLNHRINAYKAYIVANGAYGVAERNAWVVRSYVSQYTAQDCLQGESI